MDHNMILLFLGNVFMFIEIKVNCIKPCLLLILYLFTL